MVPSIAIAISEFSSDWNFRFAKVSKIKQQSLTHDVASTLMYKPLNGNTGIAILSPAIELLLAVRYFPVVLFVCLFNMVGPWGHMV